MATKSANPPIKTIEITNFGGRLTRIINGDLNSGFANFQNSWGYDPFSKPGNLTWLEQPTDITGTAINDLILAGSLQSENTLGGNYQLYGYFVGSSGSFRKIQVNSITNPNVDSVIGISSITGGGATYNYGASIQPFNNRLITTSEASSVIGQFYVSNDNGLRKINADGGGDSSIFGANNNAGYVQNIYHPLALFQGFLLFGNGPTFGAIDSTNTIISPVNNPASIYSAISPQLPSNQFITDMEVSPDFSYLNMTTSGSPTPQPTSTTINLLEQANATGSNMFQWNGAGNGLGQGTVTVALNLGSFSTSALKAYFGNNFIFSNDSFGSSVTNGIQKILTLPNSSSPFPNAVAINGNFLTWIIPELSPDGTKLNASLFYFGNLDSDGIDTNPGLWRISQINTSLSNGFIAQAPFNIFVTNKASTVNASQSSILSSGYGKHYFSVQDVNSSGTKSKLFRFLITPMGTGLSQGGFYQTQTQLFSKKITIKQIRIYTEPTVNNNSFNLYFIGSDGNPISNNPEQYFFQAGTDLTLLQGSLERIDFNPQIRATYALGLQIQNTGSTNMTIHKIEVDYVESGK